MTFLYSLEYFIDINSLAWIAKFWEFQQASNNVIIPSSLSFLAGIKPMWMDYCLWDKTLMSRKGKSNEYTHFALRR